MLEARLAVHLRKTQQRLKQMMREQIGEYGLTFRLFHILKLIEENPGANQKEIATQLKFTPGAMSGSVKRLIELEMIEQIPQVDDLRYNRLTVTEHGKAILKECREQAEIRYKRIFAGLTEEETDSFSQILTKINANLDELEKNSGF